MNIKSIKGQSLSFHTIIIAVIAVLVLVVVIYLIVGSLNNTKEGTNCAAKGGICMDSCDGIYDDFSQDSQNNPLTCSSGQCCKLSMS